MSVTFISARRFMVNAALVFVFSVTKGALAAPPRVAIDVGTIVECKDVTPKKFAETHSQQRVIEAKVRLSVLLQSGREADLEQLQVAIGSPDRRMRVVDFQPRTELGSELAGDVEVCNSNDTVQSLNASLGGVVGADHGPAHVQASPAAGVGVTQNRGSKETFHRLSPKQTVLASGTTNAEHGVFFKWRHTTQVALEGSREVTIRFLVPHDWRGDWLEFQAEMLGRHRNYLGEKVEPVGQAQVFLALYRMGDGAAQQAALVVAAAQTAPQQVGGNIASTSAQSHVAYKPVVPAESRKSQEWFPLPSMFKLCNHERPVVEDSPTDLSVTLEALRGFSGTPLAPVER